MDPDEPIFDSAEVSTFERAMRDVVPLTDRGRTRRVRDARAKDSRSAGSQEPSDLVIEWIGDRMEGLSRGVPRRELDRLLRGEIAVDDRLDLHGFTEREARGAVFEVLEGLWRRKERCLLVIHGRGLRSAGRPVLKNALSSWLAETPWHQRVRALTTADPSRGGTGATLILLRRSRK